MTEPTPAPDTPEWDPLTLAVGRVIMEAATLEYWLGSLLIALVGGKAEYIVQGQPVGVVVQGIETLSAASNLPELLALTKQAKPLFEKRDQVAHSIWFLGAGEDKAHSVRPRRHGKLTYRVHTPATLLHLADSIGKCSTLARDTYDTYRPHASTPSDSSSARP